MIGITTLSRKEHTVAQTRELACTKDVLPQVIDRGTCVRMCVYVMYIVRVRCVCECTCTCTCACTLYVYKVTCLASWCILCFIGLNIKEVAHDYATSVSDYVINELQLLNSYDTWHGMYNL